MFIFSLWLENRRKAKEARIKKWSAEHPNDCYSHSHHQFTVWESNALFRRDGGLPQVVQNRTCTRCKLLEMRVEKANKSEW